MKNSNREKFDFKKIIKNINWKDKNTYLVIFLLGLLLIIIAIPTGSNRQKKDSLLQMDRTAEADEQGGETSNDSERQVQRLERRLGEILSKIDRAGRVEVMITLEDTGEQIVEKDEETREGAGGETTVYTKEGNVESPFVSRTCTPKIAGVLVVAEGAGDSVVKQEILSSVQSLFAIEAHKITVVKMSMQEGEVP